MLYATDLLTLQIMTGFKLNSKIALGNKQLQFLDWMETHVSHVG